MRKQICGLILTGILGLGAAGCGVDDDFQAANRLLILDITGNDSTAPVFYANEKTDDLGRDGQADTGDEGEGNLFPDQFEPVTMRISNDIGKITLENIPRLGVEEGVDLTIYQIDVSYVDATGAGRAFAPTYQQPLTKTIKSGESASIEFTLVPLEMKTTTDPEDGLRTIFLYGTANEIARVSQMMAFIDVYARDDLNNDRLHVQGRIQLQFVDPMKTEIVSE